MYAIIALAASSADALVFVLSSGVGTVSGEEASAVVSASLISEAEGIVTNGTKQIHDIPEAEMKRRGLMAMQVSNTLGD